MNNKDGGPAFPEPGLSGLPNGEFIHPIGGMTLRDYFAAKAIEGCDPGNLTEEGISGIVEGAYMLADAMLRERAK